MNLLVALPILIPFATAAVMLVFAQQGRLIRILGVLSSMAHFFVSVALLLAVRGNGIQVQHVGRWPAPYGITLVADPLSAIMILLTGVMGIVVSLYSLLDIKDRRRAVGFYPLLFILLMGVSGAFLTGDIFNLYVWFEVLLISSFVLLLLDGERPQIEGGVKYVTLNLVSSGFFLAGVGILYGQVGTLNMADLVVKLNSTPHTALVNTSAMLLLVAFSIKAAAFPFFFWLPDSYHTPPFAVSVLFSGLLTKVGVYAMIRCFALVYNDNINLMIILFIAALTMLTGVLGAVVQNEMRRLLSFHIISQIGYSLMGLGLFSRLSLSGAIFFTFHVAVTKAALFLVAGAVGFLKGTNQLKSLGGLYKTHPLLAVLFLIPALSLAGMPPLSGFVAKLVLVRAGLEGQQYLIIATALIVSMLTLYSMTKIWAMAFWKPEPEIGGKENNERSSLPAMIVIPLVILVLFSVVMGLCAEPLIDFCNVAAGHLVDPAVYIESVLGGVSR